MQAIREPLSDTVFVYRTREIRFGEDALRLAAFARPQPFERVCDLGTGGGILPLWWHTLPDPPRQVDAVDIQPACAALATASVRDNGLSDRIAVYTADWNCLPAALVAGTYDRVTCNPPYFAAGRGRVSQNEADRISRHEPHPAMLRELCAAAAALLKPAGVFCLCHRPERLPEVVRALRQAGLRPRRLQFVSADASTPPWLFLCETVRERAGVTPERSRK